MYRWEKTNEMVRRLEDGACIPVADGNRDWKAVQEFVAGGGIIEVEPEPTAEEVAREERRVAYMAEAEVAGSIVARLRAASPQQVRDYITTTANGPLTSFTAPQRTVLAELAVAIGYALRGGGAQ